MAVWVPLNQACPHELQQFSCNIIFQSRKNTHMV